MAKRRSLSERLHKPKTDPQRTVPWTQIRRRDGGGKIVRLQKAIARRTGGDPYTKHTVVIPRQAIDRLGWTKGQQLLVYIERDSVILSAKPFQKAKRPRKPGLPLVPKRHSEREMNREQ